MASEPPKRDVKLALSQVGPVMVEALCYHEALLRLGYVPGEIYVQLRDDDMCVVLVLGERRFTITAGPMSSSNETFSKDWRKACEAWNGASQDELMATFSKSSVYRSAFNFSAALVAKGFDRHLTKAKAGRSDN